MGGVCSSSPKRYITPVSRFGGVWLSLVRASRSGRESRRFESSHPDQLIKKSPSIGNRLMGFFYRGVALCFPQRRRGTECVLRSIEITAIDHAHNPVPHQGHAKVHYQTDFQAGEHKTCP